jgi:hypothetical protein
MRLVRRLAPEGQNNTAANQRATPFIITVVAYVSHANGLPPATSAVASDLLCSMAKRV